MQGWRVLQRYLATTCRTTPGAIAFWLATFLVLYGIGQLLRRVAAVAPFGDTISLASLAGACFLNFRCHRTLHCGLTAPLFLTAAVVAALVEGRAWTFDERLIWAVTMPAVWIVLVLEWRVSRLRPSEREETEIS
jgi:hypothetical protein